MAVRRGKAGGEKAPEESSSRPANPKAKADSGQPDSIKAAWGKPPGAPPRTPPRTPQHMSSSSTNGLAKAKAQAKTSCNIAALAARNLGGFVPNKIFVGGVPIQCTEEQFKAYFERFGGISKIELHALRGFGYITYESIESVDSCLEKYEEHYLCKKWVEVKRSIPRELIESYEREQKRLEAEFKAESGETVIEESPSVKVETPSNSTSSTPVWGMPPAHKPAMGLPGPGARTGGASWGGPSSAPKAAPEPGGSGMSSQISQLTDMGFSEEVARRAFRECGWDVNKALDRLLTTMGAEDDGADDSPSVPSMADDPPLSAAASPTAAQPSTPQNRPKDVPAWGKPAGAPAWGKPAGSPSETVWGAPKPAATGAWGKAAPPPVNKAPPGTPKANATPKASFGSPKAGTAAESTLLPPAASPPPAPSSDAASGATRGAGGYEGEAAARSPAKDEGGAAKQPVATTGSNPATPPSKTTGSSVPSPPAVLPPAATTASPGPASGQSIQNSTGAPTKPSVEIDRNVPPSSQPPPPEVHNTSLGEESLEPSIPATSNADVVGVPEAAQEPIATAITTRLVADDTEEAGFDSADVNGADNSAEKTATSDSKAGPADGTDGSAAAAPAGAPPRKRIQRMKRDWPAEDPSQLSASEGDFVSVWVETGTDHGWIHAEIISGANVGSSQVGWLPLCVLHELPNNQRWMRATSDWKAMGESQCNVESGKMVNVWVDSRTDQGWTYVEATEDSSSSPGWLPDFCIEWNDN